MRDQPIEIRTLILVLAGLAALFAATAMLARWYEHERLERAQANFQRGFALAQAGRYEQAIERFRSALAVARGSTQYRLALARSLMALGRLNEAAVQLQEVLRADPADALTNLLLARIAAQEGRTNDAVNYYQRSIFGYWRDDPQANRLNARWELISLLSRTGQNRRVVAELLGVAEEAPENMEVQKRVARMLLEYGAPTQAIGIARSVVAREPRDPEILTVLGRAEMTLGNDQLARNAFRRALLYAPEYEPARKYLEVVTEALSLDPTIRGLRTAERVRRSRNLVTRALESLERCMDGRPLSPETSSLMNQARISLSRKTPNTLKAAEADIALAEALWELRPETCAVSGDDEPVARVLARIAK